MLTFEELYHRLAAQAATGETLDAPECDPHQLDCLLHPERYAPVLRVGDCACAEGEEKCAAACLFHAIERAPDGSVTLDPAQCVGCSACIDACENGSLAASRDILPALAAIKDATGPVYALIAPAFHGQFSENVTPGKLRAAFQALGFDGLIEVALFADILTLKEALEFDHNIHTAADYQLTSCCCPMWIAMLRRVYQELMPHVPGSVSPMVAAGRAVKKLHPGALTIFIGPCIAKKAEAREPDIADAVDFVLTFQEVQDIFAAADIRPETLPDLERDHSSRAGRIYARAGGVSEAVRETVARLHPGRDIGVRTQQADGVPACKAMIEALRAGKTDANFFEGMGCVGGCAGGPKSILSCAQSTENISRYGDDAPYATPLDNPYVPALLARLGFDSVESFLETDDLFTRQF